jgi:Phage integrase, N-terminal SAM-like domain
MTSLRRRILKDMQLRNLSPQTQTTYLQQVARFARHFQQSPKDLGPESIRAYQLYLTTDRKLAIGSIGVAVAALRFFYTVTLKRAWRIDDVLPVPHRPQRLPVCSARTRSFSFSTRCPVSSIARFSRPATPRDCASPKCCICGRPTSIAVGWSFAWSKGKASGIGT